MKRLLLLLPLWAFPGCKKDSPEYALPPATQEGKNTAGCLIDGQTFLATGFGSGLGKVDGIGGGFAEDSAYNLRLSGKYGNRPGTISLFIANFPRDGKRTLAGVYLFNQNTAFCAPAVTRQCLSHAIFSPHDNPQEVYGTDAQHTGKIAFTSVDVRRLLAAGTFEFTAVSNLDPTKTIRVTSGRFDRQQ